MNQPQSYVFQRSPERLPALRHRNSFEVPVLVDFWADWCELPHARPDARTPGHRVRRCLPARQDQRRQRAGHRQPFQRALAADGDGGARWPDRRHAGRRAARNPNTASASTPTARARPMRFDAAEQLWLNGRQDEALQTLRDGIAQEPPNSISRWRWPPSCSKPAKCSNPAAWRTAGSNPENRAGTATARPATTLSRRAKADFSAQEAQLATDPNAHAVRPGTGQRAAGSRRIRSRGHALP